MKNHHSENRPQKGFTLVELLVVISIMAIIAGLTVPALKGLKKRQQISTARAELEAVSTALDSYKAKYGTYPPGNAFNVSLMPQLYYELSGTKRSGANFVTLDGRASIPSASVSAAYGVAGFINCTKGVGDDGDTARNFLSGAKQSPISENVTNNGVPTTVLITSVGGPDQDYKPLNASGLNPIRYRYPGVNNPNSYDLWVQLKISGQTNLICNWTKKEIVNSPLP